jgi:hypothetical protein
MNLNELNTIEEGIVSSIKGMFSGQGGYQTNVQDIFIKDFVQDAITSLNNGVKGGLIDANIKSSGQTTAPASTQPSITTTPSSAAVPTTSPTQVPPAQQTGQKMSPQQTTTANMQTKAGVQPTGQKMTPAQRTQAKIQAQKMKAAQKPVPVKESSYDKMNRIFESIINIDEAAELRTIGDFMMDWFTQYMQGVNWQKNQAIVQQKLDKLQDEYPKNTKENLTDLARIGLALSKTATPAGAPQEFSQARKQQETTVQDLKNSLATLAKSDSAGYNELIKTLKPVAGV